MRAVSTLIVFLALVAVPTILAASKPTYPGIVLTSIDAKDIGNNKVEFSGNIAGDENDRTTLILKNVKEVRLEGWFGFRYPVFEGERVTAKELKASVKKPLLSIHGFSVQPQDHLETCRQAREKFKKFDLIPVMWPSTAAIYFWDRDYSKGAGEALMNSMNEFTGMFPRKSLIAHSMGNRVLRHAADGKFKFDNIFMCAADVNCDIFSEDYIKKDDDGLRISKMLNKRESKIYCLHNAADFALIASVVVNGGTGRLGAKGAKMDKLHPELKGKVENIDCGKWLKSASNFAAHGYLWDPQAIAIYESKCI